ncbi:hypothetical protein [Prosthecochloris sp.]|uniref:hypothetical protein n=1 Tax=Prosthecochloris sp. TaxID=290513 RepID=UPI0025E39CCF|nr:hypothetical protein [Prosthecochloris sp.]
MLLLTIPYNGEKVRCSTRTEALEHQWHGVVERIDPVTVRSNQLHGGYLRVSAPTLVFTPELFRLIGTYPPLRQLQAEMQVTGSDETSASALCSGVLMLQEFDEFGAEYEMYSDPYLPIPGDGKTLTVQYSVNGSSWHNSYQDSDKYLRVSFDGGSSWEPDVQFVIAGGTSLATWGNTNTLIGGFFTKLCAKMGLTLDSSLAVSPDPAIAGSVSGDSLLLDVADLVAAYFGHFFYIDGGTLYLLDADSEYGSAYSFGRFDFLRTPKYSYNPPLNSVYDSASKKYIVGNTLFGQELNAGQSFFSTDNRYLQKAAEYHGLPQVGIGAMELHGEFVCGRHLTWIDDRQVEQVNGEMVMRSVQYEFGAAADKVTVVGEAALTL